MSPAPKATPPGRGEMGSRGWGDLAQILSHPHPATASSSVNGAIAAPVSGTSVKTEQVDSWQHLGRGKPSQGVLPCPRHFQVQCVSPSYRKGTKFSFSFAVFSLDTCEADCIERGAASCWGRVAPQGLVGGGTHQHAVLGFPMERG